MKIGLSFVTLAGTVVLALSAGMAQARVGVGEGQATIAKTQAAEAAAMWHRTEAAYFNKTKRHYGFHRSLRPDERAGVHGVAP
jgi:hypothetical protein